MRRILMIALLSGLTIGCGAPRAESPPEAASPARTVRVGLKDAGREFELRPGDRLMVALEPGRDQGNWTLVRYPGELLTRSFARKRGSDFVFEARSQGHGSLLLVDLARFRFTECSGLRAAKCPLAEDAKGFGPDRAGTFVVSIRVA